MHAHKPKSGLVFFFGESLSIFLSRFLFFLCFSSSKGVFLICLPINDHLNSCHPNLTLFPQIPFRRLKNLGLGKRPAKWPKGSWGKVFYCFFSKALLNFIKARETR